jgi:hypothetical protein
MPQKTINDLTLADPLDGTEKVVARQGSTDKAATVEDITDRAEALILPQTSAADASVLSQANAYSDSILTSGLPAAITNYQKAGGYYWALDSKRSASQSLTNIISGIDETIGQTGSGADIIWAELDGIPAPNVVEFYVEVVYNVGAAAAGDGLRYSYSRVNGGFFGLQTDEYFLPILNNRSVGLVKAHMDALGRVDIFLENIGGRTISSSSLHIAGYYNS